MTCKKAAYWLQIYIDGRLEPSRLPRLEQHLAACDTCRQDLALLEQIRDGAREEAEALVAEPTDLTERVLYRIAAYEARRAARTEGWLPGIPRWAIGWRSGVVALFVLAVLALLQPGALAAFTDTLSRHANSAYTLLMMPGPDSISWGIWAGGVLAALALTVWFVRADASAPWRRAISQRLPQLW
jgi:anti-sigma factor RsiW